LATSKPSPAATRAANDATAVLVNHNSGARLASLFEVLLPEVRGAVVVDNASTDGSLQATAKLPGVSVVRNAGNRGFAAAANQGAAGVKSTWLLFVNPDIHLLAGQITALLDGVPDDVAVVAPLQVDEHDTPRSETGGYEPSLSRYLVWAVVPVRFHRKLGPWLAPPFPTRDTELDWASGALLGVRREVFERLGGLDEKFFLYHEDIEFARRVRAAGHRVLVRPAVRLHHEVSHGDPSRRVNAGLRSTESLALDFPPGWRRRALGLVLGLGYGLRALLARGTTQAVARATLLHCRTLIAGRLPVRLTNGR